MRPPTVFTMWVCCALVLTLLLSRNCEYWVALIDIISLAGIKLSWLRPVTATLLHATTKATATRAKAISARGGRKRVRECMTRAPDGEGTEEATRCVRIRDKLAPLAGARHKQDHCRPRDLPAIVRLLATTGAPVGPRARARPAPGSGLRPTPLRYGGKQGCHSHGSS